MISCFANKTDPKGFCAFYLFAYLCSLLTFVNSLGSDHAQQNVWLDLDPNY